MSIIGDWVLFTSNRALQNSFRSGAPNMIYLHTQGSNLHFSFNWYIILLKNDKAFFIILKRTIKKWKKKNIGHFIMLCGIFKRMCCTYMLFLHDIVLDQLDEWYILDRCLKTYLKISRFQVSWFYNRSYIMGRWQWGHTSYWSKVVKTRLQGYCVIRMCHQSLKIGLDIEWWLIKTYIMHSYKR